MSHHNYEKLQKENQYYRAEISKLKYQVAQRDGELHTCRVQIQELANEKKDSAFRYQNDISSLQLQLQSLNTDFRQYVEETTKMMTLRFQQPEGHHPTALPPAVSEMCMIIWNDIS